MSMVGDRFSITGDDGVFLCSDKIKARMTERQAAAAAPPPKAPGSTTPALGLNSFADVKGDLQPELFQMEATQAHLKRIVDRIADVWPFPDAPRPKVLVSAGTSFNAMATADNTIIVMVGVFAPGENETESGMRDSDLYWLLAHEYAHIALGHTDKPETIFRQVRMLAGAANAYMSGAQLTSSLQYSQANVVDPELGERIGVARRVHDNLRFITKSLVEPAWGRVNEDEADAVGTDLITSLGYYPQFAYTATRFERSDKVAADRIQAAQTAVNTRLSGVVADPRFKAAVDRGDTGAAFGAVGESIKKGVYDFVRQWVIEYLTRDHRSAKAREEGLDRYKETAYVKAGITPEPRPLRGEIDSLLASAEVREALIAAKAVVACQAALTGADLPTAHLEINKALATRYRREAYVRFWAARVAIEAGDRSAAITHLEAARVAPSVSPIAYRELAKLYTGTGQVAKAQAVIAEGRARTGDGDYFLPEDVRISARAKDKVALGALMKQCRATKREQISIECTEALLDLDWSKLSPADRKDAMRYAKWGELGLLGGDR